MKKFFALGTFLTLVSQVNAGSFYTTFSGGIALPETIDLIEIGGKNEKDTLPVSEAFSGEFGIGYDFENTIRTDITYSNANHEVNSTVVNGEIEINNISVNIYKDFKFDNSKFTPYIGAGIGSSRVEFGANFVQPEAISRSALSYQVKFGASYSVSKKTNLFLESSYLKVNELTFDTTGDGFTTNPDMMSYKAGLRYTF